MLRPLIDTASIFSLHCMAVTGCDFHQNGFSGDSEIISRRSWELRLDLILVLKFLTSVVCPARCLGGTWPSLHFEFSDLDGVGSQNTARNQPDVNNCCPGIIWFCTSVLVTEIAQILSATKLSLGGSGCSSNQWPSFAYCSASNFYTAMMVPSAYPTEHQMGCAQLWTKVGDFKAPSSIAQPIAGLEGLHKQILAQIATCWGCVGSTGLACLTVWISL